MTLTESFYNEYYHLLSKPDKMKSESDKERINEMKTLVREHEVLGDTPEEQKMYKDLDRETRDIRENGLRMNPQLKVQTIQEVRNLIRGKKLDWI